MVKAPKNFHENFFRANPNTVHISNYWACTYLPWYFFFLEKSTWP